MTDLETLIARCLQGDQSSYEAIYSQFAPGIYRLCYSLLLHKQDAEDVMQETFVYAFRNLNRYDSRRAALKTWLYTIAISRCRNQYRRKHPLLLDIAAMFHLDLPAPKSESPESVLVHQNTREAIETALAGLSPRLREAVVLRYGHNLTYREIAAIMDCPQKTAESRVRLAHDALRGVLQTVGPGLLDELVTSE